MKKQDIEVLENIFENVNNWLKFAETKNATLIGFSSLAMFTTLRIIVSMMGDLEFYVVVLLWTFIAICATSIVVALLSFVPKLVQHFNPVQKHFKKSSNFYFFGELARMNPKSIVDFVYSNEKTVQSNLYRLRIDIAEQIVTNSKIAINKYKHFEVALLTILTAVVFPFVGLIVHFICD